MTDKNKIIKKIIKVAVVIAIIAITIVVAFGGKKEEKKQKQDTAVIQRRTISNAITASGQIKSENSKAITSSAIGLKVASVNIKEGDKIEKGDLVCTFDVSSLQTQINDIRNNISKAKKEMEENTKNINKAIENANTTKDEQIKSIEKQIKEIEKQKENLKKELENANEVAKVKQKELDNYKKTYDDEQTKMNNAEKDYLEKQNTLATATATYNKEVNNKKLAENSNTTYEEAKLKEAENAKLKAENELADSKSKRDKEAEQFKPINEKYAELNSEKTKADAEVLRVQTEINNLNATHDGLKTSLATLKNNTANTINNSSAGNSTISLLESQASSLQKQIDNSKVYSPISGTVTTVNVSEGDTYIGTAIAKVEGMESYILEAQIDEYDIPDVKIGQEVIIKTDATRDVELKGYITYVAQTATETSSALGDIAGISSSSILGSSKGATYKIEASIETETNRLRIGMTAKANIISEKKENVLSLPYDAIQENDNGDTFIQIVKSKNEETGEFETENIDVKLGIVGSYYSEIISDKIEAGTEVIVPKREADSSLQAILDSMGSGAGI